MAKSSKQSTNEQAIGYRLKTIELLNSELVMFEAVLGKELYSFEVEILHQVNEGINSVLIIIGVKIIREEKAKSQVGYLKASCIFEIVDFEKAILKNEEGQFIIPLNLASELNNIAIGTTRGIMFAQFKGTQLHNAILPVIMPAQVQAGLMKKT